MHSALPRLQSSSYDHHVAARIMFARLYRWQSFRRILYTKLSEARDVAQNPKAREVLSKLISYHESRQRSPERLWSDSFFVVGLIQNISEPEPDERGIKDAHLSVLLAILETLDT